VASARVPSTLSAADVDRCLLRVVLLRHLDRLELAAALDRARTSDTADAADKWDAQRHVSTRDARMLSLAWRAARSGDVSTLSTLLEYAGYSSACAASCAHNA
jgi:hypothetical protein